MIKKTENCTYCGEKMESKTAKKKFCSTKCRVYYKREIVRGTLCLPKVGGIFENTMPVINDKPFVVTERKQHKHSLTLTVKPIKEEMVECLGDNKMTMKERIALKEANYLKSKK